MTKSQQSKLDSPLTLDEVQSAAASFPASKAPEDGGIPVEVYTRYGESILLKLRQVFIAAYDAQCLPESRANIILLLKPGKDPLDPRSYRPISLLQGNVKILAKVLAMCYSVYCTH